MPPIDGGEIKLSSLFHRNQENAGRRREIYNSVCVDGPPKDVFFHLAAAKRAWQKLLPIMLNTFFSGFSFTATGRRAGGAGIKNTSFRRRRHPGSRPPPSHNITQVPRPHPASNSPIKCERHLPHTQK